MSFIPYDLHYLWPQGAYLTLFVGIFILLFWLLYRYRQTLDQLFLAAEKVERSKRLFWIKVFNLCMAWLFASLALMQPVGNGHYLEGRVNAPKSLQGFLKRKVHDVILLIDTSASMATADSRLGQTRLETAKEVGDEILASLTGESAALYAFTSQTERLVPLTMDAFFVRMLLSQMAINQGGTSGTNFIEALAVMRQDFFAKPSPKLKTLIIISDGGDTSIENLEGSARQEMINSVANLVGDADTRLLRVYTIGVGSSKGAIVPEISYQGKPVTSHLQADLLQRLAEKGRGRYYAANQETALAIAQDLYSHMLQDPAYYETGEDLKSSALLQAAASESSIIYERYFQWPLGIALIFLILSLLLPETLEKKLGGAS